MIVSPTEHDHPSNGYSSGCSRFRLKGYAREYTADYMPSFLLRANTSR